jgi:hypothetical protein
MDKIEKNIHPNERPPKPDNDREYVWFDIINEWIDVTPKTKNIVRFIRKEEHEK